MKKPFIAPNVHKAALYAIVVNAIQIAALVLVVLMALLGRNRYPAAFLVIVVVIGLMAIYGAGIDIQEAIKARRREHTITELQTVNNQMDALNLELRAQRHDFLNHLQVVYSLLEMGESDEAAEYLENVYAQLKSVSKVLRTQVTAFNALLQVKSAACEEKGITLDIDIRSTLEGLPVPPWEICCVVGNLMDNAMDAIGDERGRIALTVREDLRFFTFTVENSGEPIPQEIRERIFEPGFSTKGEGRGMGLSIVRKKLEAFGGSLTLAQGDKTSFTVTIPRETRAA